MVSKTEIMHVLAEVLDVDHADITEDVKLEELPAWDSVNAVRLMVNLESELGIRLAVDQVMQAKQLQDIIEAATQSA